MVAELAFQHPIDLLADGVQLAAAVASGHHEVVEFRGHAPHIEHDHVLSAVILRGAGGSHCKLPATLLANVGRGAYFGDGSVTSDGLGCKLGSNFNPVAARGGEWENGRGETRFDM